MDREFIVIIRKARCSDSGYSIEYSSDLRMFPDREQAIKHGYDEHDSDDFNIGCVENGRLISFEWIEGDIGEDEKTLKKISSEIGLTVEGFSKMKKYYVSGCAEIDGDIKTCADDEANFFTLYKRENDGLSHAVADFTNRKDAEIVMTAYEQRDVFKRTSNSLAAEVDALKAAHKRVVSDFDKTISQIIGKSNTLTSTYPLPVTTENDAYLNSVRADAICSAIAECTDHCDTDYVMDAYDLSYEIAEMRSAGAIDLRDELVTYSKQIRFGTHDTADKAG